MGVLNLNGYYLNFVILVTNLWRGEIRRNYYNYSVARSPPGANPAQYCTLPSGVIKTKFDPLYNSPIVALKGSLSICNKNIVIGLYTGSISGSIKSQLFCRGVVKILVLLQGTIIVYGLMDRIFGSFKFETYISIQILIWFRRRYYINI